MDKNQHGSKIGRSTLSQLLEHHREIIKMLENGHNVDSIYFNFAKAFDKCDHGIVMGKVKTLGVSGKLGRWIHNFLTGRQQKVVVNGKSSSSSHVTSGVPQGTVLGALLFLIYISDIGDNIESIKKIYVDDTKVKKAIANVEDVEILQADLDKLYDWAKSNNMVFNGKKFQIVRYGPNEDMKMDTIYFTDETNEVIEQFETLRDLGVIISETATFDAHIEHVSKKVRQKIGWVLRTFYCRQTQFMKTIFKSLILPHIDYCSQLWMPLKATGIQEIEKLQKYFMNRIPEIKGLNYWDQLIQMKMLSLQRRQERYRILYVWKIMEGQAPNCGLTWTSSEGRTGRKCDVPQRNTKATAAIQTLREQTFQVNGPQLFNSLPGYLRNISSCPLDDFKFKLDKYLQKIPDEPNVRGLTPGGCTAEARPSNSILDQRRRIPEGPLDCRAHGT